ncbi:MAG: FeoA family protein [bacterium]|nr:FeoA family protein [bacterium]
MKTPAPIPIQHVPVGSSVQIVSVSGGVGAARRALELGIIAGMICRIVRKAPFGGPLEIEVGKTRIGIRPAVDLVVLVRLLVTDAELVVAKGKAESSISQTDAIAA